MLATGEVKCIDEEVPFEIPQGWEWCRVNDLMKKITDGTHRSPTNTDNGEYMYITAKNIKEDGISLANISFVSKDVHDEIYSRCNPEYGDLLYIKDGATTGIVTINNIKKPFSLLSSVALLKPTSKINANYILYFLRTPLNVESVRNSMKGCAITRITLRQIEKWLVPVPPLEEQQRIVDLINELLPYLDKYSTLQMNLDLLNVNINDKLKKSILQEAIQGKLVSQKAEEGTAQKLLEQIKVEKQKLVKEGKLKKSALNDSVIFCGDDNKYYEKIGKSVQCIDEEIPFEIPENWVWVRLGTIVDFSKSQSLPSSSIKESTWVLDLEDIEKDSGKLLRKKRMKDVLSKSDKHIFYKGNVLYSKLRPYLNKVIIADEDGACTTEILAFDFGYIFNKYAQLFLMSPFFVDYATADSYGIKMPRLGSKKGNNALFPIPPLREQQRIVEKIEQLMQLLK